MSTAPKKSGNARQIAVELAAILRPQMKRIERRLDRLVRAFRNHDRKADGEADAKHPWLKLDDCRASLVEDVFKYMQQHRSEPAEENTIARACKKKFKRISGGYPNAKALANYCYSLPLTDFI